MIATNAPSLLNSSRGRTFLWMWAGQSVSLLGSGLTAFALGVWLYQRTGQATPLFLTALFGFLPGILLGSVAGAVVDRVDRKAAMMLADLGQGLTTLTLLGLLAAGRLEPWMIYGLLAAGSAAGVFQWPAQAATVSLLVPREALGRANGLLSMSDGFSGLAAPILAGALVSVIGVAGVMLIDVTTFVFAVVVMAFLRIPRPERSEAGREARGSLRGEVRAGWRFILARPGLFGLLLVFAGVNFTGSLTAELMTPLVLARTGGNTAALGLVFSAFGLGGLLGGALMTAWGGPKPRVHGVFAGIALSGLIGQALFGLGRSLPVWLLANFVSGFMLPILNGSSQAIWQAKVEPDLQGRVFATRRVIAQFTAPLAFLVAGPLADRVFEPAMRGDLGARFEPVFGGGPGRGFALMFVVFGLLTMLDGLSGYLRPRTRRVEVELPDAEGVVAAG